MYEELVAVSGERLHVLLVDDEENILDFMERVLRREFRVTRVTDPLKALALLEAESFDLLISDQRMPAMTGLALVAEAARLRPSMLRLIVTGYSEEQLMDRAITSGALHNYILKPTNRELVFEAIRVAQLARDS